MISRCASTITELAELRYQWETACCIFLGGSKYKETREGIRYLDDITLKGCAERRKELFSKWESSSGMKWRIKET